MENISVLNISKIPLIDPTSLKTCCLQLCHIRSYVYTTNNLSTNLSLTCNKISLLFLLILKGYHILMKLYRYVKIMLLIVTIYFTCVCWGRLAKHPSGCILRPGVWSLYFRPVFGYRQIKRSN